MGKVGISKGSQNQLKGINQWSLKQPNRLKAKYLTSNISYHVLSHAHACAWHSAKCYTGIISFNLYNQRMKLIMILFFIHEETQTQI